MKYHQRDSRTKEQIIRGNTRNRERNTVYVYEYLARHPCVRCGEADPVVLEFDHTQGEKRKAVSCLALDAASFKSLDAEIAKCQVLCANCHRRKTSKERGWYRYLKANNLPTRAELNN